MDSSITYCLQAAFESEVGEEFKTLCETSSTGSDGG